jgi:ADP-heptose:LPS heptosyltransferase
VHIAAAVGTPVVVIMDRLDPHCFTPVGAEHRLVYGSSVASISVDKVYKAAHELLALSRTDSLFRAEHP